MSNAFYPDWLQDLMTATGNSPLNTGNGAAAIFVDTDTYTYSTAHNHFDDLSAVYGDGGSARGNAELLASKTYVDGTFDAADTVFASVDTSGNMVEGIIIFVEDGSADATSPLVAFFDTGITGMPFGVTGAQATITWDGAGIFDL